MKAIIIGATSGIGAALAKEMSQNGWIIGLTGRRTEKLKEVQDDLSNQSVIQTMDVNLLEDAREGMLTLIDKMGGVDVIVVNAGVGWTSNKWEKESKIVLTNVAGCHAVFNAAFHYFAEKGGGHIVGISSISCLRGSSLSPSYSASKAFMSTYLEGLRNRSVRKKFHITVTDIRPGFVKTPMTEQNKSMVWVAPVEKAARQIYSAIKNKRKVVYITKRWWLVAQLLKVVPDSVMRKVF